MHKYTYNEIIRVAKHGNDEEWNLCLNYIHTHEANSDEMMGVYEYLKHNDYSRERLNNFISSIENQNMSHTATPLMKRIPTWVPIMAASVLLVSVVFINKSIHDAKLHIAAKPLPVFMDVESDLVFNKAMSSYKKGDYSAARAGFSLLNTDTAKFYNGISAEMSGDYNGATMEFAKINRNSVFVNMARLHMAACLIELNKQDEAKLILENFNSINEEEAQLANQLRLKLN